MINKCILEQEVCHTSTTAPQDGNPGEVQDRGERCHGLGLGLLLLPALGNQLLKAMDIAILTVSFLLSTLTSCL